MITKEQVEQFRRGVQQLQPAEHEIEHYFANGMYMRKMTAQAGSAIVGKEHKTEHLCIVAKGRALIGYEGAEPKEYSAGDAFVSKPGTRRVFYVLEDIVFINVMFNPENERDLEKIEEKYVLPDNQLEHKTVEVLQ